MTKQDKIFEATVRLICADIGDYGCEGQIYLEDYKNRDKVQEVVDIALLVYETVRDSI